MATKHLIINGDSRDMSLLDDHSVHLIITSPPYWQLKDYDNSNQIGFHQNYETYINNLNIVWSECYRVLHPGCRLAINIGDQFARSVYYGRYKVIPIRTEIIRFCETIGMDYMGAIIWQKVTTTNTTGGGAIMGSFPYPRNGIVKIDYEFILLFKKLGTAPKPTIAQKESSLLSIDDWKVFFSGHWNFPGVRQSDHMAMFPEELPSRLIRMFSFTGETVLDPFLGSGTTSLAALNNDRNSIGFEVNPDYTPIIKQKLKTDQLFTNQHQIDFINQKNTPDIKSKMASLPYIFKDPMKLDKKIDPKKLTFGSRIAVEEPVNNSLSFFSVKKVLSPVSVLLENDLTVVLAGLKGIESKRTEAQDFLKKLLKSEKVTLRKTKTSNNSNTIEAYLYLRNKLFVNGHLLRSGFVSYDETSEVYKKVYRLYR